jgi:hypothetical protein
VTSSHLPREGGGADGAGSGGDVGTGRLRQARDKGRTRGTGGSPAAPQSEIAARGERLAVGGEILGIFRRCLSRPVAGCKANPAWGTMGDDVHCAETERPSSADAIWRTRIVEMSETSGPRKTNSPVEVAKVGAIAWSCATRFNFILPGEIPSCCQMKGISGLDRHSVLQRCLLSPTWKLSASCPRQIGRTDPRCRSGIAKADARNANGAMCVSSHYANARRRQSQ